MTLPEVPEPRWLLRPPAPPAEVKKLARTLQVPPALAAVLWSRGVHDAAPDHLTPPLELSPNPALGVAAERLAAAIKGGRRILIHGDYDADGISGTAVLLLGLRELGGLAQAFIPNRLVDGYGIAARLVEEHAARADLFVTVDCGVSNLREIAELQARGVEVIVTDHHTPGDELPDCLVVHPSLSPLAQDGLPELTGAGVAFHLLWALRELLGMEAPLEYSDLATIGTIADVAPLLGENRALIREGLERLPTSRWPGLRASVASSRLGSMVSAREVAFVLAPRLNAAGRLGEAELGLELVTTSSERRARELAIYLEARNQERRQIQDAIYEEALLKVEPGAPAIVIEDDGWHPGVIGIVASKLVERFYLPVFIAGKGRGSVRSTPGISAVAALRHAAQHLRGYGGHLQAAGFSIDTSQFGGFRQAIYEFVSYYPRPTPTILGDGLIDAAEVNVGLWRAIRELEPFGEGHPEPLFVLTDRLEAARAVGRDGATLQLRIGGVKGVAWQKGDLAPALRGAKVVNAAVTLREAEWRDVKSLEFVAEAVRQAAPLGLEGCEAPVSGGGLRRAGDPLARGESLRELPPGDAVEVLEALASGPPVTLSLSPVQLAELESEALGYPTVEELRRSLVALRRDHPSPYEPQKAARAAAALVELGLVDGAGRPRRLAPGTKMSPYDSEAFLAGLLRRYRLRTFVHAYRYLDDSGFAATARVLFQPS